MDTSNSNKLLKNIIIFAISRFLPKLISFFMTAVYTSHLSTIAYGTSDVIFTTASLLLPILTLDVSDAVMRFTIENRDDKRALKIGQTVVAYGCLVLLLGLIGIHLIFDVNIRYLGYIFSLFLFSAIYQNEISYMRGMERVKLIALSGMINSSAIIILNAVFLLVFNWGIDGYILSNILGYVLVDILGLWSRRKDTKGNFKVKINKDYLYIKEMLRYSSPLVLSGLAWWVNSASDRYFVTWLLGAGQNGIYSVAYKIPTILRSVEVVFSSAWTLTVFDVYKKENGINYISKIYDIYSYLIIVVCSVLIVVDKTLAKFLYANDFYNAWKYVPTLLISTAFINMGSCLSPIMMAYKESKKMAQGSVIAAIVNLIFNYVLIITIGVQGAAIATAISYMISWLYSAIIIQRICNFKFQWIKQFFLICCLVIQAIIVVTLDSYWFSGILTILIVILNLKNTKALLKYLIRRIEKYLVRQT